MQWPHGVVIPNRTSPQWNGLIHWWPTLGQNASGGTLFDIVGGLDGAMGSATARSYEHPVGVALEFDGSENAPIVCDIFEPPNTVSVALWAKVETVDGNRERLMGSATSFELVVEEGGDDGHLACDIFEGGGNGILSSSRIDDDTWRHIVVTHDASHTVTLYIDGKLDNSGTTDGTDPGAAIMTIGNRTGSGNRLNGSLADIRIYNRVLSAAEVAQMYATGTRWELYGSQRVAFNVASAPPVTKVIAETEATSEGSQRNIAFGRLIAETVALTEAALRPRVMLRLLADTVAATEARAHVIGFVRAVGDTVATGEAIVQIDGIVRRIAETVATTTASLRPRVLARILSETEATTDAAIPARSMLRTISDTVGITTAGERLYQLLRSIGDTVAATEGTLRPRVLARLIAETAAATEATIRARVMRRTQTDSIATTEGTLRPRTLARLIAETAAVTEALHLVLTIIRAIGETAAIADGIRPVYGRIKWVGETVAITTRGLFSRFIAFALNVKRTTVRFLG